MLKPGANQAKVETEDGIQLVVEGRANSVVAVHCGVLTVDGDDTIILASGTVETHTENTGPMPFEASGGWTMAPSDEPWFETEAGKGLVVKTGGGAEINGWIRWTYRTAS